MDPMQQAQATAMLLLAQHDHSTQELQHKLQQKYNLPSSDLDALLTELTSAGYLDDQSYAECVIRSRSARGYGSTFIQHYLQQKGVASETIMQAEQELNIDWLACLADLYAKKYRGRPCGTPAERQKRQRFLYSRGFSYELIRQVLS